METKIMYILVNGSGERMYQYAPTEYIDVAERYKRDWCSKHTQPCRIATMEIRTSEQHISLKYTDIII